MSDALPEKSVDRLPRSAMLNAHGHTCAHPPQVLDLIAEDERGSVYGHELKVRPPPAPTAEAKSSVRQCPPDRIRRTAPRVKCAHR